MSRTEPFQAKKLYYVAAPPGSKSPVIIVVIIAATCKDIITIRLHIIQIYNCVCTCIQYMNNTILYLFKKHKLPHYFKV